MKREKNQHNMSTYNSRSPRVNDSNHDKQRAGRFRTRDDRSNFKKGQSGTTKRKMEETDETKKNKFDTLKASGKISKFRTSGKKQWKKTRK